MIASENRSTTRILYGVFFGIVLGVFNSLQAQSTNFTLGASSLLVGPLAGLNSVVLAAAPESALWTSGSSDSWLHLSASFQSGVGSTNVIFSYDANPGRTRCGTLVIAGQKLTVKQAGANFVQVDKPVTLVFSVVTTNFETLTVDEAGDIYFSEYYSNTIRKWTPAKNETSTVVSSGLNLPNGLMVDKSGSVYIADAGDGSIKVWSPPSANVVTLASSLGDVCDIGLDNAGNVYSALADQNSIVEWMPSTRHMTTLTPTESQPVGVKFDRAGNAYIANFQSRSVQKWTAVNKTLSTLVSLGLFQPDGVAVDGQGNVYISDAHLTIKKWIAASGIVSTLVSLPPGQLPGDVVVDAADNLYFAASGTNEIMELPYVFVDTTPISESPAAGSDTLPGVLPSTANLLPPFAPTTDQTWLHITGITNGAVSFTFAANEGARRTAHITLLGQSIPVTQLSVATLPILASVQLLENGLIQIACTNVPGAAIIVLSTTNLALPLDEWTAAGTAAEPLPGQYQFTNALSTNGQCFYTFRSP